MSTCLHVYFTKSVFVTLWYFKVTMILSKKTICCVYDLEVESED